MSKWAMVLTVVLLGMVGSLMAGTYGGGSGTEEDPYQIADANDLIELGATTEDYDKHFIMTADIDLTGYTFERAVIAPDTVNSNDAFDGTSFTGVFDGNGHTITNLVIDTGGVANDYLGLFGQIEGSATEVKNLGLDGCYVIGPIAEDCGDIGCLIGRNGGTVSNCYATGDVNGGEQVGGLVGDNDNSISGCYATGNASGTDDVGGLVGDNEMSGIISNSYATGDVNSGVHTGGGLVGDNEQGTIINCYSTGAVASGIGSIGGLTGYNPSAIMVNSFWDTETSGQSTSAGGTGKTTFQMKQQSTFTDWDFINTWNIGENQTYPYLRKYPASDINKDRVVNLIDLSILAEQWMEEE